jgi:hypothetical protein
VGVCGAGACRAVTNDDAASAADTVRQVRRAVFMEESVSLLESCALMISRLSL